VSSKNNVPGDPRDNRATADPSSSKSPTDSQAGALQKITESVTHEHRENRAVYAAGVVLIVVAELIFLAAAVLVMYLAATRGLSAPNATVTTVAQAYGPPLFLVVAAAVSTLFGFLVLHSVGAANRLVIPAQDREMLGRMIEERNVEGIELYIRLSSLSGPTGFFQKIGVYGLPLATIILSVGFGILALFAYGAPEIHNTFADLAKLSLGAFLGSYVQRQQENNPQPSLQQGELRRK
jgi:hypothetical protein